VRSRFLGVWDELWACVWDVVAQHKDAPDDVFCELYREVIPALKVKHSVEDIAETVGDPALSRETFQHLAASDLSGEWEVVEFLETANDVLEDLGGEGLSAYYRDLLRQFIEKYSLGYDLDLQCRLSPNVSGIFSSLVDAVGVVASRSEHLHGLYRDFEESIRAVRDSPTDNNIKTCVVKQVNLIEALACEHPMASQKTIGAICNEVATWPHDGVKDSMKSLYRFCCDYPGIRHGGSAEAANRPIELRDMLAMSILLMGFVPYLSDDVDPGRVYRGA
jgi:hypothetical protein